MGHCVHNQESGLTKGHLQEDALNSNALDLMLGIAANHLPEARWPPGLAMDPPYKEEGEQGNFETLRTVKAPESSIGEDKDKPSPGSNTGAKLAIVGNQDNPDVCKATDHVAKWTNLGQDIEMRDTNKGLKTIEPEQPCISPRKLKLKQSSTR
ncbi:hypothetical protein RhiTH_004101 [Rhizoctonia solani]